VRGCENKEVNMKAIETTDTQLPWQTQVLAALSELDSAKSPSQRMAALGQLRPLFAGNGARKAALRNCLALLIRAERMGEWEIRALAKGKESYDKKQIN
jgi:hypothetical protein